MKGIHPMKDVYRQEHLVSSCVPLHVFAQDYHKFKHLLHGTLQWKTKQTTTASKSSRMVDGETCDPTLVSWRLLPSNIGLTVLDRGFTQWRGMQS
jgi:hypothetical protein